MESRPAHLSVRFFGRAMSDNVKKIISKKKNLQKKPKPVVGKVNDWQSQIPLSIERPVAPPGYTGPRCGCRDARHKAADCPVPGTPPAHPSESLPRRLPGTPTYDPSILRFHPQPAFASTEVTDMMNLNDGRDMLLPRDGGSDEAVSAERTSE